jgi:hypothetical protein
MSLMGKVGTRLNVNANYDTQSTFAFQIYLIRIYLLKMILFKEVKCMYAFE